LGKGKKIVEKVGRFLRPEKCPSTHHDSPPNHHNFTTKHHVKNARFRKNPL
jgi:hypothetical protein